MAHTVTLSVVEGSHVRPPHALREMSRQARHDRNIIKNCVNLSNLCHLCAIKHNAKLSFQQWKQFVEQRLWTC